MTMIHVHIMRKMCNTEIQIKIEENKKNWKLGNYVSIWWWRWDFDGQLSPHERVNARSSQLTLHQHDSWANNAVLYFIIWPRKIWKKLTNSFSHIFSDVFFRWMRVYTSNKSYSNSSQLITEIKKLPLMLNNSLNLFWFFFLFFIHY